MLIVDRNADEVKENLFVEEKIKLKLKLTITIRTKTYS